MNNLSYRKLSIRNKLFLPLLSILVLFLSAFIIINVYSFIQTYNYDTKKYIENKINSFHKISNEISNDALYIALISSKMPFVQDAYKEYYASGNLDSASLIIESHFSGINEMIQLNTGHEARIHFHLPPARSFIRLWSKKRGDDISDFRNSVLKVSKEHIPVKGIETGRGGFVIRGIAPIFSPEGKYYGSVEAFFNINHLVERNITSDKEDFAVFMNTNLLDISTKFLEDSSSNVRKEYETIGNYISIAKTSNFYSKIIPKKYFESEITEVIIFNQNHYKYVLIPIKNYVGKSEGIGILQVDISDYKDNVRKIIIGGILIFLLISAALVFVLGKLINKQVISRIKSTDAALKKLSNGELIDKIKYYCDGIQRAFCKDEISNMQYSLNILNETITKNTKFAIEIGKGNLKTEYELLGDKDLLGNSLIEMRNKLLYNTLEITKALKKAKKNKNRFKILSDLTFEGVLIHNDGVIVDLNHSLAKMFEYEHHELLGKHFISTLISSDYQAKFTKEIKKTYTVPYETEGVKRNGFRFPIELEAREFSFKNNRSSRVMVIRDISARKKAEREIKKLSTAVEQSANTIVITDTSGKIEYINPKFTEITGYTAKEVIGKNPRILNAGTQSKELYKTMWQTIKAGNSWRGEFHNKTKDNQLFWEFATITPIKDKKGKIINFLGVKEDITAIKKATTELIISNKKLTIAKERAEESDRLKSEFLANISHEIRTPLNGIMGFSSMLNFPNLTKAEVTKFTDIIVNCSEQLLNIIDDILEISILNAKQLKASQKTVCINKLLSELFMIFEIKSKESNNQFHLKKSLSDEQSTILTDDTKLRKILSNLIENAFKFTKNGFIGIGYHLKGKEIEFFVKDSGIGIKPEKQAVIFERFAQEENEIANNYGGLGLGLAIAKENTALLGGKIYLASEKGKGTTFFVRIPYVKYAIEVEKKLKLKK